MKLYIAIAGTLLLVACTAETSVEELAAQVGGFATEEDSGVSDTVATVYELGDCDVTRLGQVDYISSSGEYYVCTEDDWDKTEKPDPNAAKEEPSGPTQTGNDFVRVKIVVRDFEPSHSDFENFSEEYVNHADDIYAYKASGTWMNRYGFDADWYQREAYHMSCGSGVTKTGVAFGLDGKPRVANPYLPQYLQESSSTVDLLTYGQCSDAKDHRGYSAPLTDLTLHSCEYGMEWSNPIYITPGMVQPNLYFDAPADGEFDMINGVHILKANELCDNEKFDQWYNDTPGANLRSDMALDIPKVKGSSYFYYDKSYNTDGFFPLDSINPNTMEWVSAKSCPPGNKCEQYGPQSLSLFCPPYAYLYAKEQVDHWGQNTAALCAAWLGYGGPRATVSASGSGYSAAWDAAASKGTIGLQHLRNYAYTMMGYIKFKYEYSNQSPSSEMLKFVASDDLWVFVDGVLVVDLGGTHLPAPGSVNIPTLAMNNHGCHAGEPLSQYTNCEGASDVTGWGDNTWHHVHFFYANRQTEGSDFVIRFNLNEIAAVED